MDVIRKELLRIQINNPDKDKTGLAKTMYPDDPEKYAITKLNRLITGKQKYIEISLIPIICNYLDITPSKLFENEAI